MGGRRGRLETARRSDTSSALAARQGDGSRRRGGLLGVAVLTSLGGRHVRHLARVALDHDEPTLADLARLHGVGRRWASISALEGRLLLRHFAPASVA